METAFVFGDKLTANALLINPLTDYQVGKMSYIISRQITCTNVVIYSLFFGYSISDKNKHEKINSFHRHLEKKNVTFSGFMRTGPKMEARLIFVILLSCSYSATLKLRINF